MPTQRRTFLSTAFAAALAPALAPLAWAQGKYPARPIALVDAFAAGGSTDIFARILGERMGPLLGGSVVVENRAGAGGALGADYVAKARPDGYTLGLATVSTLVSNPAVNPKLNYDPQKDFAYITKLLVVPSVLVVHPSLPVKNLRELIALAKAKPETLAFASPGNGSAGHVLLEQFMQVAGVRFVHVPYRGGSNATNDLLGGQVQVSSDNLPSMLPHIQAGRVRALAVRDNKRLELLPDVPTYAEAGYPEVSQPLWFGLVAPAGTPADIVAHLNAVAHKAVASSVFQDRLKSVGATAAMSTPEAFRKEAAELLERYRKVAKAANIQVG